MAQRILGLDLGASAVKAVLVETTFRGWSVIDHGRVPLGERVGGDPLPPSPLPPTPPSPRSGEGGVLERHAAAVRALLAERSWSFDGAVVAFPGAGVSTSVVTLPFTDLRRIEQTIGFEVEGQIPFDLADVAWDWQPLAAREGKTELLVAVARRADLGALLVALSGAGVDPSAVVPAGTAYAALALAGALAGASDPAPSAGSAVAPGAAEEPPASGATPASAAAKSLRPADVVVDVGWERTSVAILADGACEAARTFVFGGAQLARAGDDPDALRRALVPLAREVRATLRAWGARGGGRAAGRILLAGEAARHPAVADALRPEVEGAVAPLALAQPAADAIPAEEAPAFALALSLALRSHLGARAGRLNLRRGDLAFTRDFEHLRGRLTRLGVYAAFVLLVAVLSSGVKAFALARQEAALDRALCEAETKIVGKCFPNFEEAQAVLRGKGSVASTLPRVSAVELLAELAAKVPDAVPVRLDRIEITKDKLHLQGTTDAAENVDRIASGLKGSRCFADARSGGARRRANDGKFEFSIDASLTCLDAGGAATGAKR
ncbi:MAG TPA: PilN domain-containing protein [Anaeromyxobacter sp.]